jgi:hypothetical protein
MLVVMNTFHNSIIQIEVAINQQKNQTTPRQTEVIAIVGPCFGSHSMVASI